MIASLPMTLLAAGLLCGASIPALAQPAAASGRNVYEAGYFSAFAPSNALQIVRRVPGFQLDEGDTEVRGFGQAAGNVVINGQRPTSKSDTLDVVLARIPASRVARVEVGPGDLFGSEYAGKPQVVNLVLIETGGLAGTASSTVRRIFSGELYPEGSVSGLLRRGASTFNASVGLTNDTSDEEGSDTYIDLPSRDLIEFRRKLNETRSPEAYVSASWAHDGGSHRTAHLNGRFADERFALTQSSDVFPTAGPIRDDRLTQRFGTREYEIGGDVTRPLLGGGLKLVGLATRRTRDNRELSLNRTQGEVIGGLAQDLDDQLDERVLRLVWNRSDVNGWSVETGAEAVLNVLESDVELSSIDAGGTRTRIDLPVDQAKVKEYRGEAFVNAGRAFDPTLRMDLGLTYEISRLTVSGDADADRTLGFLKPKATFDWRPGGGWHLRFAFARTVAQLQFVDFISVAELASDRVNGGNADLEPQRSWELLATAERPILGDGLIKLEAGYNRTSKVQDRVPTPDGFDAPGNLGTGHSYIGRATIDMPLTRLGIKGGRLNTYVSVVETSVTDPYTFEERAFSGNSLWIATTSFRQDLGTFAWGFEVEYGAASAVYRRNEIDRSRNDAPYVTAFVEYRPDPLTTLTFGLDNAIGTRGTRERTFFSPDRRTLEPDAFEFRERNRHVIPYVTVKRNFG
jgi:hypothetical protein